MGKPAFMHGQGMFKGSNYEMITIATTTGTPLTVASYGTNVMRALVTIESNAARYRYDGVSPTVSTGHYLNGGDVIAFAGLSNIQNCKFIAVSGTADLHVTYEVGI